MPRSARPPPRSPARSCSCGCTRSFLITLTVETADWKELADGSVRIEQTIYVERESQRKIVLGAKGQTIKEIGSAARAEIGEMAGVPVHLFLFVKVGSVGAKIPSAIARWASTIRKNSNAAERP